MKKLILEYCTGCPHFKFDQLHGMDEHFLAICTLTESQWQCKRGRQVDIPKNCPLEDDCDCSFDTL